VRDLGEARFYMNRELSWLEFNQRVLEEAQDASNPLLERLKFLAIVSSNLDEFFEVRVAGLQQQAESRPGATEIDGMTAQQQLDEIAQRVRTMTRDQYRCFNADIVPGLSQAGIHLLTVNDLEPRARDWTRQYFEREAFPVLTPLAIDPAHPFPQLLNKSLNLAVKLSVPHGNDSDDELRFGVVQVPRLLPRLVSLPTHLSPEGQKIYIFQSSIVSQYIDQLFPGLRVEGCYAFRVTRNSELYLDEDEADNLLEAMQESLQRRRRGDAVRLEVQRGADPQVVEALLQTFELDATDLYEADGPVNLPRLMAVYSAEKRADLKDPAFAPSVPRALRGVETPDALFGAIRHHDILLHHPYESFQPVVDFVEMASQDPNVLAIKQTVYRASAHSPIVRALMKAAENGKQVTALVELKARFDEENNIQWARQMEEAGVHVLYGLVGLKTHCKMCLVVRREHDGIRRYVHLGTGNYNEVTARLYTDTGLLTARPEIGEDASKIFNLLTGMSHFPGLGKLHMAPFGLADEFKRLVERETAHARRREQKVPPRIIAKMNSLVAPDIIQALYRASQAGVQIDLIIRGVCCLRPGVPGVSDNIRVRSIIDRFLEHSRIWYFSNNGEEEIFCGSADWMPRNFYRRIEVVFPVEEPALRARIKDEILAAALGDNVKARVIHADGTHSRVALKPGDARFRSQHFLLERAAQGMDGDPRKRTGSEARLDALLESRPAGAPHAKSETATGSEKAKSSTALEDFNLVPRSAPRSGVPSGDGRAGTNTDPVLLSLAEEARRYRPAPSPEARQDNAHEQSGDHPVGPHSQDGLPESDAAIEENEP
jgi:polyphosphate kinase